MTVLVVEDDAIAFDIVKELLEINGYSSIERAPSVKKAIKKLEQDVFDLIFLDVHLEDGEGTDIVEYIPNGTNVVFTTSDPTFAVKAFEMSALDYIVKPVTKDRFSDTIKKIKERTKDETLLIKADLQYHKISIPSILYIKSNKDYLTLYTENSQYTFYARMKNFIKRVPKESFMQCHRSYIINLGQVQSFNKTSVVIKEKEIPVSNRYKNIVVERITKILKG